MISILMLPRNGLKKNYLKVCSMKGFIELVREMRNAQKEYFKTRDKNVLQRSKELERKVDSFLAQLVINQQTSLFP